MLPPKGTSPEVCSDDVMDTDEGATAIAHPEGSGVDDTSEGGEGEDYEDDEDDQDYIYEEPGKGRVKRVSMGAFINPLPQM